MSELKPPRIPERQRHESICWFCRHAVPGKNKGCSWSRYRIPVPGWVSKDTIRRKPMTHEKYTAHKVQACPLFEKG